MLTGVLTPDKGKININGFDITQNPIEAKKEFAFVSDDPDMFLKLKGIEYLNFIGKIYKVDELDLKQNIFKYSKLFEMEDALNDKIESYSHGMRQKINIIAALIHEPKIWILDEPLTGLDPKSSFTLKQMMREHADNGNIVLFSTHVLEVAEKVCDHVFIINKGKIIYNGEMGALKNNTDSSLEEIFLELVSDE
jgi:ABC-2 type transport system ATP-binding protein